MGRVFRHILTPTTLLSIVAGKGHVAILPVVNNVVRGVGTAGGDTVCAVQDVTGATNDTDTAVVPIVFRARDTVAGLFNLLGLTPRSAAADGGLAAIALSTVGDVLTNITYPLLTVSQNENRRKILLSDRSRTRSMSWTSFSMPDCTPTHGTLSTEAGSTGVASGQLPISTARHPRFSTTPPL